MSARQQTINVTISLSRMHKEFVEAQAAQGGFPSVSTYLDALVDAERRRKAEEQLIALVQEAEKSGPATPMTSADWDNLKRRVRQREALSKGSVRGKNRQTRRR
jgi:antitoxin ParD1/3/4